MASEKITAIIDSVKELSVLELKELIDAYCEEFGVSAVAAAAPAAAGAAAPQSRGVLPPSGRAAFCVSGGERCRHHLTECFCTGVLFRCFLAFYSPVGTFGGKCSSAFGASVFPYKVSYRGDCQAYCEVYHEIKHEASCLRAENRACRNQERERREQRGEPPAA